MHNIEVSITSLCILNPVHVVQNSARGDTTYRVREMAKEGDDDKHTKGLYHFRILYSNAASTSTHITYPYKALKTKMDLEY